MIIAAPILLSLGFVAGKSLSEITPQDIEGAEKLIGLQFSPAEKDSMITNLKNYRKGYEDMRKISLENATGPSLHFNPLPFGFVPIQEKEVDNWDLPMPEIPKNIHDIAFLTVAELSTLIKSKKITSKRLTQIYLDRIKTYSDTLQCLVTLMEGEALQKARAMDNELNQGTYRGPLHGIPYGLKDLLAVKGTKTTWGAMPYKDQTIDETATIVEKLDKAGAVLIGKFTLGALAMGDVWYGGVTKNPWNLKQGSSGSSAGFPKSSSPIWRFVIPLATSPRTCSSLGVRCWVSGSRSVPCRSRTSECACSGTSSNGIHSVGGSAPYTGHSPQGFLSTVISSPPSLFTTTKRDPSSATGPPRVGTPCDGTSLTSTISASSSTGTRTACSRWSRCRLGMAVPERAAGWRCPSPGRS